MSAGKDDIKIEKGATYNKTWLYKDSTLQGIPLTGYEARMQVRERKDSTAFIIELTSVGGDIILEDASELGRVDVRIGADATDLLNVSTATYDLELYMPADVTEVIRLVEGAVIIKTGVTR